MANAREQRLGHGKGRGSPEAVEKRRAARALNAAFDKAAGGALEDGRAERRRQRLIRELKDGRRGKPLPPIDVLTHAAELLALGETLASLERAGIKARKTPGTPELVAAARRVQVAYDMPAEVFGLLGLDLGRARGRGTSNEESEES
jgi:hypothetical protein